MHNLSISMLEQHHEETWRQRKRHSLTDMPCGEHGNSLSLRWWLHTELVDPFQAVVEPLPTLDK